MIRRIFWLLLMLLPLLIPAASLAQGSGITYPPETEVVRGVIDIRGTAQHGEFWKYELAAAPFGTQNWFNIGVSETVVINGVLGRWDTNTVPDGTYSLRLRVVRLDGNFDEYFTQRVLVGNTQPPPTPTPEESPTPSPTPTATFAPPTPTPIIVTPDIPTPSPEPTATPPLATSGPDGPDGQAEDEDVLASLGGRAASAFMRGARTVVLLFVVIGTFFAVKSLLAWFYYRFLL